MVDMLDVLINAVVVPALKRVNSITIHRPTTEQEIIFVRSSSVE